MQKIIHLCDNILNVQCSELVDCHLICDETHVCIGFRREQCCNWFINNTCAIGCLHPLVGDFETKECGMYNHHYYCRDLVSVRAQVVVSSPLFQMAKLWLVI